MFSLASVATMSACIFLFGLFFSILVNFQYIIRTAEQGVAITVFFEEDATEEQKQQIGEQLEAHDGVADVVYVSAEEAWDEFQKEYFGDNPELACDQHQPVDHVIDAIALMRSRITQRNHRIKLLQVFLCLLTFHRLRFINDQDRIGLRNDINRSA